MRYFVGFVVVTAIVGSPLSVSAQQGDEGVASGSVGAAPVEGTRSSQSWLERVHPEAFEAPAKKHDSGIEIEYVPVESQPYANEGRRRGLSKGGKIAIGVLVPLVVVCVGVGAWAAVSLNRDPLFGGSQ